MGGACPVNLTIHPSLILWLSVLFYLSPELVLPFLLAAGFHEWGHYMALRIIHKPPLGLTLSFSGAKMNCSPLTYGEERLAAAAGPLCSLILALLWPILPVTGLYSLVLGMVNLLPLPGLDGYRILSTTLYQNLSPAQARKWVNASSIGISVALILGAGVISHRFDFGLWPCFLAFLFFFRALQRLWQ